MKRQKTDVESVDVNSLTDRLFFDGYIATRTPVKFNNPLSNLKIFDYTPFTDIDALKELLDFDDELMIEEKLSNGFGNGNKRIKMTFQELIDKFKNGEDRYYLTTQYDHNESDEEEEEEEELEEEEGEEGDEYDLDEELNKEIPQPDPIPVEETIPETIPETESDSDFDFDNLKDDYEEDEEDTKFQSLKELFQPPLTNIYHKFPLNLKFFSTLIPQQINLWMGCINPDNIPEIGDDIDVEKLGKIIPDKGTSSGLHHDHSDNLYVLIKGRKRFTIFSPFDAEKLYTVGNILSIYENGVINYKRDQEAPEWNFMNDDGSFKDTADEAGVIENIRKELDPPNFSKIPPTLIHLEKFGANPALYKKLDNFTNRNFPDLIKLKKHEIWLDPGQMLYLPAGWFHEVSSFPQQDSDNVHLALNYWFAPPNTKSYDKPYKTDYWSKYIDEIRNLIK